MGHPGFNNLFLVETSHELALRYNDQSPLENMHAARLFDLLRQPNMAILAQLDKAHYREIRQVIVEGILSTDYVNHVTQIKEVETLYQVNQELFESAEDMFRNSEMDAPPKEVIDYLRGPEVKKTLRNVFLHMCDISNPMKPFPVSQKWALLVLDEFGNQGDREKELGMPVGPLNDRTTLNMPLSQAPLLLLLSQVLSAAAP
ncbi:unnamed protein product [Polarella glacialis]|uniref:PDEase domain-containing protein n=1 Tax=Polarella glacialis TaxID=89957 RepID=A0A813FP12_POLGL|nr:unnamed protein product [Polarella glacialis]